MSEQDNDRLLEQIKQQLDTATEHLDAPTRSRLTRIRNQALTKSANPGWSWQLPALALGSTAAVVLLSISLLWTPTTLQQTSLEDLPLLSSNEDLQLIDDVEFYQWLGDENQHG